MKERLDLLSHTNLPDLKINFCSSVVADLPLKDPMRLPFGLITSRPSGILTTIVEVDKKIAEGFGEGATLPEPVFTDDSGKSIASAADLILDQLRNGGVISINEIIKEISEFEFPDGHIYPTARMMVEMAILDGYSKAADLSMLDLLGVNSSTQGVHYGKSIGEGTSEDVYQQCLDSLRKGAKKLKLKVSPNYYKETVETIKRVRDIEGVKLMVDANGSFDPENAEHISMLRELDQLGLLMIEEPVSRVGNIKGVGAVKVLREKVDFKTKICLDDCLKDLSITLSALNTGLADVVNIKPGRIGSIVGSIKLAKYCKSTGKEIMVGGMLEATPGRCMTVSLAALFASMGFEIPGDISLPQERLAKDIVEEKYLLKYNSSGEVVLPRSKGWGFGTIILSGK